MVGKKTGQRFAGHGARSLGLDTEPLEESRFEILTNLVSHRPLVALHARFRTQVDMLVTRRAVRAAALRLTAVEADIHAEVPLGQGDNVYRRRLKACRCKQVGDRVIDYAGNFLAL